MKKLLLLISLLILSLSTWAADVYLNPFAYDLSSSLSNDKSTLTVNYKLNSTATSVNVQIYSGAVLVKTVDCSSKGLVRGLYSVEIPTADLPGGEKLSWKVTVQGTPVDKPVKVTKPVSYHSFYYPHSVAIDKNPESAHFGRIIVSEPYYSDAINQNSISGSYVSKGSDGKLKPGLYVFNPDFYVVNNGGKGYTGGETFNKVSSAGHQPWIVRVSDDSRIFVSSGDARNDGVVVWEVDPDDMNKWTPVIRGNLKSAGGSTENGVYCVYKDNNYTQFVAGLNCSMDVKGSGDDLKLLLYSVDKYGMEQNIVANFLLHEYNLGTSKEFTGLPTQIDLTDANGSTVRYGHYPEHAKMYYDGDYGYWFAGFVNYDNNENYKGVAFAHALKKANGKHIQKLWDNSKDADNYNGGSGVKIHKAYNGEEWVFKGVANTDKFQIYKVTSRDADGTPYIKVIWDGGFTGSGIGTRCNDFAVDYAENLYIVGNRGERILAFKLPYSGTISTPAASKYSFELESVYGDPQLAPFAYDLRRTKEGDGRVKLHFMLNAHARQVKVILEDKQASKEYVLRDYPTSGSDKNYVPYHSQGYGTVITTEDIERLGLSYNKNYSWRVDVYGEDIETPTCVRSYDFYHPSAIAIDNNPQNETFGMILANEAKHEVKTKNGYMASGFGAGIYEFSPSFKHKKNGEKPGYNGGITFTNSLVDNASIDARSPFRIRISEDGRIFVGSFNTNGNYLWEVNPQNLDEWNPVFQYNKLNSDKESVDAQSNFIAGPNISIDVKGTKNNLKLLLYSANLAAINSTTMSGFKCYEYDLGTAKTWSTAPSKLWLTNKYVVNYAATQVAYDNDGGIWIATHRGTANDTYPGLVHIDKDGNVDLKKAWSNVCCAVRFNRDYSKMILAGHEGTAGKATIYTITKDANGPVLNEQLVIDMSSIIGTDINDAVWDYAGNLYVCGNKKEKLAAYVMPRSQTDVVSTPARDEYVVNLKQPVPCVVAYNLTYTPNGAKKTYDFSFYANTQPTSGTIRFYKNNNTKDLLYTQDIASPKKGTNTVSIPMATLDEKLNLECDVIWEIELSASSSEVFGKIYQSDPLNTAYATIDVNPESDYFGQIYATNQEIHTFAAGENGTLKGEICVWAPDGANGEIYHTIKENYKLGINLVGRLCVAPDGKLYISDNGRHGGLYVMNPKDYSTVSFFEGCTQGERSRWFAGDKHVGAPSSCPNIYWTGENTAQLFVTRTEYHTETNIGSQGLTADRHNEGYFVYPLAKNGNGWSKDWNNIQIVDITEDNLYQNDFSIVGTSHGAWLCQHRYNEMDVFEARSLMFYDKNGVRQYCSDDNDAILGSAGAAVAINKEETRLAMSSGNGGIMFFSIEWSGDKPTLKHEYTSPLNNNYVVTSLNFDYAGNLVATVGDSYNDNTDRHRMIVFTTPKADNTVVVPARFSQRMAAIYADERNPVHIDNDVAQAYQTADVYRPLVAGMCNTICLPFAIADKAGTPYENAKIFSFVGVVEGNDQLELQFTEVTSMQAGVPYLIQPESDITDIVRFTNVAPMVGTEPSSVSWGNGVTFHGTINPKDLAVDANYLFLVANNRLATASEGGEMLGLRGYFTVNGTLPSKAIISFREGTATGVTSTIGQTDSVQKILQNQQILIIKGGKTYNVLGTHVK